MKQGIAVYICLILLASLVQVSILALPLGVFLLLFWFYKNGDQHLVLLSVLFSVFLSIFSTIPAFLILISVTLSLLTAAAASKFLPSDSPSRAISVLLALGVWEGGLFLLQTWKL